MKKFTQIIQSLSGKYSFPWLFLCLVASVFLLQNPWFGQEHLKNLTGGYNMIDMQFYNSPEEIRHYLDALQQEGRSAYRLLLGFDFFFILSLMGVVEVLLYKLSTRSGLKRTFTLVRWLPLGGACFDLLETSSMLVNSSIYPGNFTPSIYMSTFSTPLKWGFMAATLVSVTILLLLNLPHRIQNRKKNTPYET